MEFGDVDSVHVPTRVIDYIRVLVTVVGAREPVKGHQWLARPAMQVSWLE